MSSIKDKIKSHYYRLLANSIKEAVKEQGLESLCNQLEEIIPDITSQYTSFDVNSDYLKVKVRALHSFQISLVKKALDLFPANPEQKNEKITVVDIGDSSGTHLLYLKSLYKNLETLSINLDEKAVEKIKKKGMTALKARAEDLKKHSIKADIFLSFEMLEHLHDPSLFLKSVSETGCGFFVITVPYLEKSRVGPHHIRSNLKEEQSAERTHIFELSPDDWKLIFRHSGWEVVYEKIYYQYPKKHPLRISSPLFKKMDFKGFYGVILKPDSEWKEKYKDW